MGLFINTRFYGSEILYVVYFRHMNSRVTVTIVGLSLVALTLGGAWYYLRSVEEPIVTPLPVKETFIPRIITAKHQFKNDVHTVVGEVDLPTPCYLLNTDSFVEIKEPQSDKAIIQFTTINESDTCIQTITSARFKESFSASLNADISATWNGKPVQLNLIEVSPDEDLEGFEIYIKG